MAVQSQPTCLCHNSQKRKEDEEEARWLHEKTEHFSTGALCLGTGSGEGNFVFPASIMEESKEWCLRWMLSELSAPSAILTYGRHRERQKNLDSIMLLVHWTNQHRTVVSRLRIIWENEGLYYLKYLYFGIVLFSLENILINSHINIIRNES